MSEAFGPVSIGPGVGQEISLDSLRPDQCAIRLENDVTVCVRGIGPHHPAHDPKAPLGVTRRQLITAVEAAERRERGTQ